MNVGDTTYYKRLDTHNRISNEERSYYDDELELAYNSLSGHVFERSQLENPDDVPFLPLHRRTPVKDKDIPRRNPPKVPRAVAEVRPPVEHGPELGVEITPAQLQQRNSYQNFYYGGGQYQDYGYGNYKSQPRNNFDDRRYAYDPVPKKMPPKDKPSKNYLNARQRSDKPFSQGKQYTLKEVFVDEKNTPKEPETSPMESVFDKPREPTPPPGLLRKARTAVSGPILEKYHDYDYYKHEDESYRANYLKQVQMEEEKARLKAEASAKRKEKRNKYGRVMLAKLRGESNSKDPIIEQSEPLTESRVLSGELTSSKSSKEKELDDDIRKKEKELKYLELKINKEQKKLEKKPEPEKKDKNKEPEWHPAWAYVLSWLVYETPKEEKKKEENLLSKIKSDAKRIVTPPKDVKYSEGGPGAIATTKKKYNKAKNNTKKAWQGTKNTWAMLQEPALNLFGNEYTPPTKKIVKAKDQNSETMRASKLGNSKSLERWIAEDGEEIILESGPGDPVADVLYYDRENNALYPEPQNRSSLLSSMRSLFVSKAGTNESGSVAAGYGGIFQSMFERIKNAKLMNIIYAPTSALGAQYPNFQTIILIVELAIFIWIIYQISRLIDALCMVVKTFCSPFIAITRMMNTLNKQ